ncbi:hypothetical protein GCM10025876_29780 [Demequina litorisediminis]|uniref:Uncharacterized protein n=1 Tax=Demequina litorisediminis TaxID=1849022 RepID=A0ABQ6IFU9_9MICO|nr:hypothetical protein GCM10025876_29780 [Demequina litorisediminis]
MSATVVDAPAPTAMDRVRTFTARRASVLPTLAAVVILVIVLIGAQAEFGNFLSPRNLSALLLDHAYLMVLAVGMTFVIVTGGIDLSVGSVMAFTGILGSSMLASGTPVWLVIPIMLAGGAAIGTLIGVLVQYFNVQPFIASLAGLFLGRGLAYVVSLSSIRVENEPILWLQQTRFLIGDWYITPTGIIALLVVAAGAVVMALTRFGRTVYAIGGSEQSARLMGLSVARTKVLVYVISGLCGGLAGLLLTAYSGAGYPRNGIGTEPGRHRLRGHRRHPADRRPRLRARLHDRRVRVRHHQHDHLVHGRRAVVDAHHHRRPVAAVHRGAAGDRGALRPAHVSPGSSAAAPRPPRSSKVRPMPCQDGPVDEAQALVQARGSDGALRRVHRPRRRRLPHVSRRGALAHGRERCGQVDPHQGPHGSAEPRRRPPDPRRRGVRVRRPTRRAGSRGLDRLPGG